MYTVTRDVRTRYVTYSIIVFCVVIAALLSTAALSLLRPGYTLAAIGVALALICLFPILNDVMLRLLFRSAIIAVHRKRHSRLWTEPLEDSEPEGFPRYYVRYSLIINGFLFLIAATASLFLLIQGDDRVYVPLLVSLLLGFFCWLDYRTLRRKWRLRHELPGREHS